MIRYKITKAELEKLIEAESPGWLKAAKKKTERFKQLQKYDEKEGSWSLIKKVFMDLQHNKCAYCERKLEGGNLGKIEHDIEHYRPKNSVKAWPTAKIKKELKLAYQFTTGGASANGYYLLPYNILNYATACKVCNTPLKSNYFPIPGSTRLIDTDNFRRLKTEKAFLIYPIGNIDQDPEKIIAFQGMVPIPNAKEGTDNYKRAQVTIDFFRLSIAREDLIRERALIIKALFIAYRHKDSDDELDKKDALLTINMALSGSEPHTNCARSFFQVCEEDFALATKYYEVAFAYLESKGY
jgi:hypothetical protein